jgi:hypothetical protein
MQALTLFSLPKSSSPIPIVPDVRAILAEADCELEIDHDCIDEYTNYQWGMITGTTKLAEDDIGEWLTALVPGNRIDLVQWRYGEPWRPSEL